MDQNKKKQTQQFIDELMGKKPLTASQQLRELKAQSALNVYSGIGNEQDSLIAGIKAPKKTVAPKQTDVLEDKLKAQRTQARLNLANSKATESDSLLLAVSGDMPWGLINNKKKEDDKGKSKTKRDSNTKKLDTYISLRDKARKSAQTLEQSIVETEPVTNWRGKVTKEGEKKIIYQERPEELRQADMKTAQAYQDSIELTQDAMKMNVHVNDLRNALDSAYENIVAVAKEAEENKQKIDMNELKQLIQDEYGISWDMLKKYNYIK